MQGFPVRSLSTALLLTTLLPHHALAQPSTKPADLGFTALDNGLRYRCISVPAARGVCAVLGIDVGSDHDPIGATGLAHVTAAWLRNGLAAEQPNLQVTVRGAGTLLSAMGDGDRLASVLATFARVLSGALPIEADAVARATAQASLAADDETQIYPGTALYHTARRALLAGTPAGRQTIGIPAEIMQIDAEFLARWYEAAFVPQRAWLVVLGPGSAPRMTEEVRAAFAALRPGEATPPAVTVHDAVDADAGEGTRDRIGAPFVTLALCAPVAGDPEELPFAIAMVVASDVAARSFHRMRGGEGIGRFLPSRCDWVEGDRLVMFNRRALDGAGFEVARDELAAFATALHEHGATPQQIERATARLASRVRLVDPARLPARATPQMLWAPAMSLAMAALLQRPADLAARIAAVPAERVVDALRRAFAPENRRWFMLLPRS
jgi:predicted Zn-dependent peptidase